MCVCVGGGGGVSGLLEFVLRSDLPFNCATQPACIARPYFIRN